MDDETLNQFTGSQTLYRHGNVSMSEGAKFLFEKTESFWFLDIITAAQLRNSVRREEFQVWTLTVKNTSGLVCGDDGDGHVMYRQMIPYTDFPMNIVKLFCIRNERNVIMLPSEY
jgi:hypothetical protein